MKHEVEEGVDVERGAANVQRILHSETGAAYMAAQPHVVTNGALTEARAAEFGAAHPGKPARKKRSDAGIAKGPKVPPKTETPIALLITAELGAVITNTLKDAGFHSDAFALQGQIIAQLQRRIEALSKNGGAK